MRTTAFGDESAAKASLSVSFRSLDDWDMTKIRTRLLGGLVCCLRSLNSLRNFAFGSARWRSDLNRFLFLATSMPVVHEAVSLRDLRGCIGDMAGK